MRVIEGGRSSVGEQEGATAGDLCRRAVEAVREAVNGIPRSNLPGLLADLEHVRAEALLSLTAEEPDRVLSPAEVARSLNRSPDWAYRNRHSLPTVRLPGGRWGVREAALDRWLRRRSGGA